VYGLIQIESLNKGTWLVYLFLHASSWYWHLFVNLNLIGLVLFEFWEWRCDGNEAAERLQNGSMTNDTSMDRQLWLGFHFCVLIIITFDLLVQSAFKLLRHLGNKSIWRELLITSSVYIMVWITFVLREYCIAEHACGYVKPLLLFLKWRSLQTTLKMFGKSIANSFAVFMLLALCISMTALAMLIVFRGEYDGDHTLNGFVESLVEMFVFMASGENYIELVNQARAINGFYVLLYIAAGFIGLVVIMSLVLATFQQDYEQQLGAAGIVKSRKRTRALTVSYCLGTVECSNGEFGSNIKYDNFVEMMNCFENAKNEKARKSQSGASVFPILFPDMPALPPTSATIDPDDGEENSVAFARTSMNRKNSAIEAEDTWHFLFNLLNADDDDGVDFGEFEYVFYLHELISYVRESPQLSFMVRLERVEAELKKRATRSTKSQEHNDVTLLKDTKGHLTQKLLDAQEVASYGVRDGLISLRAWDRLALVLVLFHMFVIVLAFSRKITTLTTEPFNIVMAIFPFYYCFEIANRAWQHGGAEHLWSNPEQPTVQFMHRIDCSVSFTSMLCVIIMLIMDAAGNARPRMLELLANVCVVRVLVIHKPFRHLLYSCATGLGPLKMYLVLMFIVYYYFSLAAMHLFRNMELEYNFDGLASSLLTMHQVYLGEGWNQMMAKAHASNLNPAVYVFFIIFYLTMGILFTQLFAGIIINLFLRSEEWRTKGGSIYVLLGSINPFLASKTQDQLENLVHDLSVLDVLMTKGARTPNPKRESDAAEKVARQWVDQHEAHTNTREPEDDPMLRMSSSQELHSVWFGHSEREQPRVTSSELEIKHAEDITESSSQHTEQSWQHQEQLSALPGAPPEAAGLVAKMSNPLHEADISDPAGTDANLVGHSPLAQIVHPTASNSKSPKLLEPIQTNLPVEECD